MSAWSCPGTRLDSYEQDNCMARQDPQDAAINRPRAEEQLSRCRSVQVRPEICILDTVRSTDGLDPYALRCCRLRGAWTPVLYSTWKHTLHIVCATTLLVAWCALPLVSCCCVAVTI